MADSTAPATPAPAGSQLHRYVELAKALADPTRMQILKLIGSADEYPCTELERRLPVSKSTISHHVKVLGRAGLVTVRREGKFFHYTLRREVLDEYVPGVLDRI